MKFAHLINIFLISSILYAETLLVPSDYSTIQLAIDNSFSNDTILVSPGIYQENLVIDNIEITLLSLEGFENTIIDGSSGGATVQFHNTPEATSINGFTIQGGSGYYMGGATYGGGVFGDLSEPILNNLYIINNSSFAGGGVAFTSNSQTSLNPKIFNCIIQDNQASEGGGIFCANKNLYVSNTDILFNGMDPYGSGGGIQIILGELMLENVNISNNQTKFGGGMYIANSFASLLGVVLDNNSAESKGGGLWIGSESEVLCNKTIFSDNYSEGFGGGIFLSNSFIGLDKVTIVNNVISSAVTGAGIYADGGNALITNSIVYYNRKINNDSNNYNLNGYSGDFFNEFQVNYSDIEYPSSSELNGLGIVSDIPEFTDPEVGAYDLMPSSPCIDSGDPESTYDPDGTISDMGALFFNQNIYIGDVNEDEMVDILDVVILVSIILNNEDSNIDLNFDGLTNIQDIIILITMILEA